MSTRAPVNIDDIELIGENDHGYRFAVGKVAGRWIGFAIGDVENDKAVFVFPDISESAELGILDRERAIRMTGAIASDPESAYGGIERWFVPEELRGKPEDFRCDYCNRVGCDGLECDPAELFDEDYEP